MIDVAHKKLKSWRKDIGAMAKQEMGSAPIIKGAVFMTVHYYFLRPQSAPKSRTYPTVKPDGDKLDRAILDALTGVIYVDDAQVVYRTSAKHYGVTARAEIFLMEI